MKHAVPDLQGRRREDIYSVLKLQAGFAMAAFTD